MLFIFGCIASFFFFAERLVAERSLPIFRRGYSADVLYIPIHYMMRVVVNGTLAIALTIISRRYLPDYTIHVLEDKPVWIQAVSLLLVLDFMFYVMHRLKHRWGWWWRLHEAHHSSVDMDFLSSVRFHPLEKLLDRTIYLLPLLILGASDRAVLIWAATDVFFGMFIHSNTKFRLGPLIYVFVGPEMHRWHHVKDPNIRECNYGNNLSIFDWIFGTAYLSQEKPGEYGVDVPNYPVGNIIKQFSFAFRPSLKKGGSQLPEEVKQSKPEEVPVFTANEKIRL